jgi:hypothetical protein
MKLKDKIKIELREPCHEPWDKMTPVQGGKHCDRCTKTVIDASTFSPGKIFSVYTSGKGNVCMRFPAEYVEKTFPAPSKQQSFLHHAWKKAVLFAGLQFLFFQQVKAQVKTAMGEIIKQADPEKKYMKTAKLSGSVVDSGTGEFLYLVDVTAMKDSKVIARTQSDLKGNFILEFKDSMPVDSRIDLVFHRRDYDSKRIEGFMMNKALVVLDSVEIVKSAILLKEIEIAVSTTVGKPYVQGLLYIRDYFQVRNAQSVNLQIHNNPTFQQPAQPLSPKINYGEGSPEWFNDRQ